MHNSLSPGSSVSALPQKTCGLTEQSPAWWDDRRFPESSPSTISVRPQCVDRQRTDVLDHSSSRDMHSTQSPGSSVSTLPQTSDQLFFGHSPPLTPGREPRRANHNHLPRLDTPPAPTNEPRRAPDNGPGTPNLHPDLAAVRCTESRLSKKGD